MVGLGATSAAPPVAVEIAVQDVVSARAARRAGASRLELCSALAATGGVTASIGLIERVVDEGLPVHVLVRPREGDFVYVADERLVMARDIDAAVRAGAAGIVSGGLTAAGAVDRALVAMLREASRGVEFTFHRAIDAVDHPHEAIDLLVAEGVDRILTSGGAARCADGLSTIEDLVSRSAGLIEVQAGGGVTLADVPGLLAAGVSGIHLSARRQVVSSRVGPGGGEGIRDVADEALIARMVAAVRAYGGEMGGRSA